MDTKKSQLMRIIGEKFIMVKTDFLNGRDRIGWGERITNFLSYLSVVNCITVQPNCRWGDRSLHKSIPANKWKRSDQVRIWQFCNLWWIYAGTWQNLEMQDELRRTVGSGDWTKICVFTEYQWLPTSHREQ